ncbi:MAG: SDR family NAD(P)-dependent oxidoreductase [SAR324 cluster bacterium]|nr:SDR family NAD(P)-dependent oxidoreductase [SAR324 cluster bacterium]
MNRNSSSPDSQALMKKALLELREMKGQLNHVEYAKKEPIAIIGIGCRFPGGSNSPDAFWSLLREGQDAIREIPSDRWDIEEYFNPEPDVPGKMYTRYGGFLDSVDSFDGPFFGLSPRETVNTDPQHRLILEVAWEALEHANQVPEQLFGSATGVFVGMTTFDYSICLVKQGVANIDTYFAIGNGFNSASGRLSYLLGLTGPSMAIDSACSSSLTTVHLACQSLRNRECNLALAGGVNLMITPEININFSRTQMLSPDCRCHTFDAAANGYVRGEGCGMLVLKRLSDAKADGDQILALVRGSAVNQDGASGGLTVPSGPSQEKVFRQALENAGVDPGRVSYIETHGTGTPLGDPIEVSAIGNAYCEAPRESPLMIGSVKTNIGHLEAAAGVVGMIKVVLALQNEKIPPHLNFKEPNPHIPWEEIQVEVPTELKEWPRRENPRLAGISGFGISGSNAHIIMEEAPLENHEKSELATQTPGNKVERPLHILTLSAKTEEALRQLTERYKTLLSERSDIDLADLCYTANKYRSRFNHRMSVVSSSCADLKKQLADFSEGKEIPKSIQGPYKGLSQPKVAFLFTGQGAQYINMGRQLYETQSNFRQTMDRCDEILRPCLQKRLLEVLYPQEGSQSDSSEINETAYTQPALFSLEYALFELWNSWGIKPSAVMGHSVGEYAAACAAGVFSLEDGLKLIAERGRLMQALPRNGEMAVVFAKESLVEEAIKPYSEKVSIAAINGPKNVVISGDQQRIEALCSELGNQEIRTKRLTVSHAFHSPLMDPMLADFEQVAGKVTYSAPFLSLVSNVTGNFVSDEVTTPEYWVRHLRQAVRFSNSIETLHQQGFKTFLEIGPKPVLLGMARHCLSEGEEKWLPSLRENQDWQQLLFTLGELSAQGVSVSWSEFENGYQRRRVTLPSYPFQHQRYWYEPVELENKQVVRNQNTRNHYTHPLLGQRLLSALKEIQYESRLYADSPGFLKDHRVFQSVIFPAAAYLEIALAAGKSVFNSEKMMVEKMSFFQPLILQENGGSLVQCILFPDKKDRYSLQLSSLREDEENEVPVWNNHASGSILRNEETLKPAKMDIKVLQSKLTEELSGEDYYQDFLNADIDYGPSFRVNEHLWFSKGEVLSKMSLPENLLAEAKNYFFHPVLLDSAFQLGFQLIRSTFPDLDHQDPYLPVYLENLQVFCRPEEQMWGQIQIQSDDDPQPQTVKANLNLLDATGTLLAHVKGLTFQRVNRDLLLEGVKKNLDNFLYEFDWQPLPFEEFSKSSEPEESGYWVIFSETDGLGTNLSSLLKDRGERCLLVFPSQTGTIEKTGETDYYLNPAEPSGFQQLFQDILENKPCRGIVHLWSLSKNQQADISLLSLQKNQILGCRSVLHLVQALESREWSEPPRLWLITQGAQPVGEDVIPLQVQQSPLWGLGNVIALEYPELRCTRLDLDPSPDANVLQSLYNTLWHQNQEEQAAWRQGVCYVPRLARCASHESEHEPVKISNADFSSVDLQSKISSEGTYLISGGLGDLGLLTAEWMVKEGARHLVLVGRSRVKPEAGKVIEELGGKGIEISVMQGDISLEDDVKGILEEIQSTMPSLKGVIHAAGVLDDGMIAQQNWERFEKVMRPKINGAWNLHRLTENIPLDFFLMFSSAASVLGTLGQSNYASANAFLDALAHYRRANGLPAASINWGPWAEIGMASQEGNQKNRFSSQGVQSLKPEEGLIVLKRILRDNITQPCVIHIEWSQFINNVPHERKSGIYSDIISEIQNSGIDTDSEAQSEIIRSLNEAMFGERPQMLLSFIQDLAGNVIGESHSLPEDVPLMEQGFDSLMAVDLKNRLNKAMNTNLPSSLLFEYPTLEKITNFLLEEILSFEDLDFVDDNGGEEGEDNSAEALLEEIDTLLQTQNN